MKKNLLAMAAIAILFVSLGAYFGSRASDAKVAEKSLQSLKATVPAGTNLLMQVMTDSQDSKQSLSQWKGKILVVNFWATWCSPCVEEMPALSTLQTELIKKDIQILGIGIDSPESIKEFTTKYKISYPLYIAGMSGTDLSLQLGNTAGGLPYTVILGKDGRVLKTYLGKLKMEDLRRDLNAL